MSKEAKYSQRYREAWDMENEFKEWLQSVPGDPSKAKCSKCGAILQANKKALTIHSTGKKHLEKMKTLGSEQHRITDKLTTSKDSEVKEAELRIAVFIAVHASTSTIDHINSVVSNVLWKLLHPILDAQNKCFRSELWDILVFPIEIIKRKFGTTSVNLKLL